MRITDRKKDVIKSGGEWISSIDLENVAAGLPGREGGRGGRGAASQVGGAAGAGDRGPRGPHRVPVDGVLEFLTAAGGEVVAAGRRWCSAAVPLTATGKIDKKTPAGSLERASALGGVRPSRRSLEARSSG
jgi:acyl-CoA synthetase (AMP-forming)/AMP-acid ligase II